jgi:hypothetical protein
LLLIEPADARKIREPPFLPASGAARYRADAAIPVAARPRLPTARDTPL